LGVCNSAFYFFDAGTSDLTILLAGDLSVNSFKKIVVTVNWTYSSCVSYADELKTAFYELSPDSSQLRLNFIEPTSGITGALTHSQRTFTSETGFSVYDLASVYNNQ